MVASKTGGEFHWRSVEGRCGRNEGLYRSFGYQGSENGGVLNRLGAWGIAQWNGPRQAHLSSYASKLGLSSSSLDAQTGFAVFEAKNRGINLNSISDIVNRFEVPAERYRAGEIAGASKIAASLSDGSLLTGGSEGGPAEGLAPIGKAGGDFFGLDGGKGTAPGTLGVDADKDTPTFAKTDALSSNSPAPWTLFGVPATIKSGQLTKEGSEKEAEATAKAAEARSKDTQAVISDEGARLTSWQDSLYDLFVRGGLIGVAIVLFLGAWVFFYADRATKG
jgi:hypothetical protein